VGVRAGDDGGVALDRVVGGDFEGLVNLQLDGLAVDELTSADLGSLGVKHESDLLVGALSEGLVEGFNLVSVGDVITVGEVEASDVHTGVDHLDELLNLVAGWAEGANNLGAAEVGVDGLEDVLELDVLGVGGYF
jgi:hypothetical protein